MVSLFNDLVSFQIRKMIQEVPKQKKFDEITREVTEIND